MPEHADMEHPVTRRALREELAPIHKVLQHIADRIVGLGHRVTTESRAAIEWGVAQLRALDDTYRGLPARVTRIEAKVFPPRRARRR